MIWEFATNMGVTTNADSIIFLWFLHDLIKADLFACNFASCFFKYSPFLRPPQQSIEDQTTLHLSSTIPPVSENNDLNNSALLSFSPVGTRWVWSKLSHFYVLSLYCMCILCYVILTIHLDRKFIFNNASIYCIMSLLSCLQVHWGTSQWTSLLQSSLPSLETLSTSSVEPHKTFTMICHCTSLNLDRHPKASFMTVLEGILKLLVDSVVPILQLSPPSPSQESR